MARTALAIQQPPGAYPALPLGALAAQLTFAASTGTPNFDGFVSTGREVLVCYNSGGAPATVTVHSVADALQRTGDITSYSVPAGAWAILGPFYQSGWKQSDGTIWVDTSATTLQLAVVRLPSIP
jgi:hypothetical protein